MPPGTAEVRHYHHLAQQFFYGLRGEISVAPGQAHQLRNESAVVLDFLVVSTPHAHGNRVVVPALAT